MEKIERTYEENTATINESNPWQKMADEVLANEKEVFEYTVYGHKLKADDYESCSDADLKEIDISTDAGKQEWLERRAESMMYGVLDNMDQLKQDFGDLAPDDEIKKKDYDIKQAFCRMQILDNLYSVNGDDLMDRLKAMALEKQKRFGDTEGASDEVKEKAMIESDIAYDLYQTLNNELERRNQAAANQDGKGENIAAGIDLAEKEAEIEAEIAKRERALDVIREDYGERSAEFVQAEANLGKRQDDLQALQSLENLGGYNMTPDVARKIAEDRLAGLEKMRLTKLANYQATSAHSPERTKAYQELHTVARLINGQKRVMKEVFGIEMASEEDDE